MSRPRTVKCVPKDPHGQGLCNEKVNCESYKSVCGFAARNFSRNLTKINLLVFGLFSD